MDQIMFNEYPPPPKKSFQVENEINKWGKKLKDFFSSYA